MANYALAPVLNTTVKDMCSCINQPTKVPLPPLSPPHPSKVYSDLTGIFNRNIKKYLHAFSHISLTHSTKI